MIFEIFKDSSVDVIIIFDFGRRTIQLELINLHFTSYFFGAL